MSDTPSAISRTPVLLVTLVGALALTRGIADIVMAFRVREVAAGAEPSRRQARAGTPGGMPPGAAAAGPAAP